MDILRNFLDSSTIHGFNHIGSSRRCGKLFWVLIIIVGFTVSGFMIWQSFNGWSESPVKTTIETVPLSQLDIPNVTVCPPTDTFTNLNYDLLMSENMTIDQETRKYLTDYALRKLQHYLFQSLLFKVLMLP